jgi:hypothetical protein
MNSSGDNHQSAMYIVSFARSRAIETAYLLLSILLLNFTREV